MVFDNTFVTFTNLTSDIHTRPLNSPNLIRPCLKTSLSESQQSLSLQQHVDCQKSSLGISSATSPARSVTPRKISKNVSKPTPELLLSSHYLITKPGTASQSDIQERKLVAKNDQDVSPPRVVSTQIKSDINLSSLQTPTISDSKTLSNHQNTDDHNNLNCLNTDKSGNLGKDDKKIPGELSGSLSDTTQERGQEKSDTNALHNRFSRGSDECEKADIALRKLKNYLQDIFEAEDQVETNTAHQYFTNNVEGGISLSINTLVKLDALLQKVIQLGRFSRVKIENLMRLHRLCEGSIKVTESLDLKVKESMDEEDLGLWSSQLASAELGIRSSCTALRIIAGGRVERQIYSEDTTQSLLKALSNVIETFIIPIMEMRSTGSPLISKILSTQKKGVFSLLKHCQRMLLLMANLVIEIDLSESVVNSLECIVLRLFFVENASTEKDSAVGFSKFDGLRTVAMDVLSGIFSSKPAQRRGIFAEILTSLEKLPLSKQSARQFKLAEGGNIQHASALIMRLIQISTMKPDEDKQKRRSRILNEILPIKSNKDNQNKSIINTYTSTSEVNGEQKPDLAVNELKLVAIPLIKAAKSDASFVIEFIVARAITTAKGAESSFRHLLDLFVQDFIACLGFSDWPAAEILLRLLLFKMIEIAKSTRSSSTARNIALDMLGQMGSKISELNFYAQKMAKSIEYCQSDLGNNLSKMVVLFFEKKSLQAEKQMFNTEILSWSSGPFRVCLEYLEDRSSEKMAVGPAIAYLKVDWANRLCESFDHMEEKDAKVENELGDLAYSLREIISDDKWLSRECSINDKPAPAEIRLAHTLVLLGSPFCQYLDHILSIFLTSMNSGQAMVQAKSLKCLTQLLDTDPGIIDRHPWVKDHMVARLEDVSSSVRENALGLISKFISLRPSLELDMVPEVLKRLSDANVSVRKRAIKLAKEIYTRNPNYTIRTKIAKTILWKIGDDEISIQELARQTMEEIWFSPFYHSAATRESSPQIKLGRAELVSLIVETIETPDMFIDKLLADRLDKVLTYVLSSTSKFHEANSSVCKALIESMFETVIDNSSGTSGNAHSRIGCFHILQVFAMSKPKLFTTEHIKILHPYVSNLSSTDNAAIYNSVVNIFKQTLSQLSGTHENLLIAIRNDLLKSLAKLRVTQLDDVIACMSIISGKLQNYDNLTRVLLSALETINKLKLSELQDDALKKLFKLLPIVGLLGKHCDFEPRRTELSLKFPALRLDTVPKLIIDILTPLAAPSCPIDLRKVALQSIGYVCFSWPKNFSNINVFTAFEQAFDERLAELEIVVLEAFKAFLIAEERRSEDETENITRTNLESKAVLGVMGGSQGDGIALSIAQRFLPKIIAVALASKDEKITFVSSEIIASVARQGLVHPKQPGVALIILGTSSWLKIAKIASEEHSVLHAKHETLFERDYMTAVQSSYDYQRDIFDDTRGAWLETGNDIGVNTYISKLSRMVQVLNNFSKLKTRKRFFENMCLQLDRNKPRKDVTEKPVNSRQELDHIKFSQYVIENIAYFDYKTFDELIATIQVMEKFVSSVGAEVTHAIELEILENHPNEQPFSSDESEEFRGVMKSIDLVRLRQLAVASIPLLLLWEARTYLRHQYNLTANRLERKAKIWKDLTMKPSKVAGVNGDKFWHESSTISRSLKSEDTMTTQCRKFAELLKFDNEFKIAAADGDEDFDPGITPEMNDNNLASSNPRIPGSIYNRKRKITNNSDMPCQKKFCRPRNLNRTSNFTGYDSES